jgi:FkbM family methyltransferase
MENNPYQLNTWLDPLIQNYIAYFGHTERPVVWEIGSRDGKDGAEIATRIYQGSPDWFWSRARVVALEANPAQAKIFEENYPEIEVHQVAASNQKGEAPFMVYAGDEGAVGSSSLNLRWKEDDLPGHVITVPIDRLENLIGDEKIDIMKIDCEGHSVEVIEGLGDKVRQIKAFHIETEKWTDSNVKMKPIMTNHGYILVDDTEQYGGMPDQVWIRQ